MGLGRGTQSQQIVQGMQGKRGAESFLQWGEGYCHGRGVMALGNEWKVGSQCTGEWGMQPVLRDLRMQMQWRCGKRTGEQKSTGCCSCGNRNCTCRPLTYCYIILPWSLESVCLLVISSPSVHYSRKPGPSPLSRAETDPHRSSVKPDQSVCRRKSSNGFTQQVCDYSEQSVFLRRNGPLCGTELWGAAWPLPVGTSPLTLMEWASTFQFTFRLWTWNQTLVSGGITTFLHRFFLLV